MLAGFGSGEDALDRWLKERALDWQARGFAQTHVWADPATMDVHAFYSHCPHMVARDDLPSAKLRKNAPEAIPAILLGQMALNAPLKGRKLGRQLLVDALGCMTELAEQGSGALIVIDPLNDQARGFYLAHDFHELRHTDRLFVTMAEARESLKVNG